MKDKKILFACILILLGSIPLKSQIIDFSIFGLNKEKIKTITPFLQNNRYHTTLMPNIKITYEHLFKKKKFTLIGSYNYFYASDFYTAEAYLEKDFCNNFVECFTTERLSRFDVMLGYNLLKCKRYYLRPFAGFGIQCSFLTEDRVYNYRNDVFRGDFQRTSYTEIKPYHNTQIVPTAGLKTGFIFWKHLNIGFQFQAMQARKPYQRLSVFYKYQGVQQPNAVFSTDGTGISFQLNMGIKFGKSAKPIGKAKYSPQKKKVVKKRK